MSRDWRIKTNEIDLAGFITNIINVTGYMVIKSSRGRGDKPLLVQSENDVITNFEKPSADYPSLFELVSYAQKAPCWAITAIGSGALYGGIDITATGAAAFSTGSETLATPSGTVTHAFYAASQYTDDLRATVSHTSGQIFSLALEQKKEGVYESINTYEYSTKREKNGFGKSIYIDDVFENNAFVIPKLNSAYGITDTTFSGFVNTTVAFAGGARGATPANSDIVAAWEFAKLPNKYEAKIMMDVFGGQAGTINGIVQTYQPYSFGISVIPFGQATDTAGLVSYRSGLGLDTDDVALYTNWTKIVDTYNDSFAWISNIGGIGGKYVDCNDSFNFASPAGIDENGFGGQLADYQVVDTEFDFTEFTGGDTQTLDQNQINPFIFDNDYGLMAKGDRTLQVSNSDTSYIGTRRGYNVIIENVSNQILKKQVFKVNDVNHRERAKLQTDNYLEPIASAGWIRGYRNVCDTSNNTDLILEQRKFVLTTYIQVTPNSQETELKFVRVGQTVDVNSVVA
jgi:hypothetical protein